MSSTYIAVIVNVLAFFLPKLGVVIGSEELTTTIQTLSTVITAGWVLYQRYEVGDITPFGGYKK